MDSRPEARRPKLGIRRAWPCVFLASALFAIRAVSAGSPEAESIQTFRISMETIPASTGSTIGLLTDLSRGTLQELSGDDARMVWLETRMEPVDRGENLHVVSEGSPLPSSYVPGDLVTIESIRGSIQAAKRVEISRSILEPLDALFHYVNAHSGGRLILVSGYRSYNYQQYLFNRKLNQIYQAHPELSRTNSADRTRAEYLANLIAARPGTSEHQFLAVDVTSLRMLRTCADPLTEPFADTPEGRLVLQNAHKFGFDVSFKNTPDSVRDSGHSYEPWHICYRGLPHSEILYRNQWSLPQYLRHLSACRSVIYKSDGGELYFITTVGTEI